MDVLRVTCGSDARSQKPPPAAVSSSADDREAKDWDVFVVAGGKMRSLMLLERQRGTGIESYRSRI